MFAECFLPSMFFRIIRKEFLPPDMNKIFSFRLKIKEHTKIIKTVEKEFEDILYVLRYILNLMNTSLSDYLINAEFASRFRRKCAITEDYRYKI